MRFRSLIVVACIAVLAVTAIALASAGKEQRPRCANCGMFTDTSSTRVEATLKLEKKSSTLGFVCLGCIDEYNEKNYDGKAQVSAIKIVDYNSFINKKPEMISGETAYFLYGADDLPGSMPPYIAAFKTKADATKAKTTLGGQVLDFKAMWTKLTTKTGQKAEGSDEAVYECKMCNYKTDKPGSCPHCGMKLQKTSK